ncbi:YadA-like family protein [Pseudoxanthomonas sp. LH2527]|uniref:YadA-like family protein n=1 Tax=Pseudoxanthomonas sp. LH2527 TaxID=2923249 RepID=UPI001F13C805|nr:YadA-like family protein [Pseudoxanthomonas sp. LH2527]
MNRIYCKVWNRALGQWVVASELARGDSAGVTGAQRRTLPHRHALVIALLAGGMAAGAQANTTIGSNSFVSPDGAICSAVGTPAPNAVAAWTCQVPNGSGGYAIISRINATATGAPDLTGLAGALGPNAVLIGTTTTQASADGAVAIGPGARATADTAIALGDRASATGTGAVAVGFSARAEDEYSVALGGGAVALGQSSYAMGNNAQARDFDVAIGAAALIGSTGSTQTTAVGYQAGANSTLVAQSTFVGFAAGAQSSGTSNAFVGSRAGAQSVGDFNVANGTFALAGANGDHNIAQGNGAGALVTGDDNVAIGRQAGTLTTFAADGTPAVLTPAAFSETVSIGHQAAGLANRAIAIGVETVAAGIDSIALGPDASVQSNATQGIAIGEGALVRGTAVSTGTSSIAIGDGANTGRGAGPSTSGAANTIAIGTAAQAARGAGGIAMGQGANVWSANTIAIGTNARVGGSFADAHAGGIAIGNNAGAARADSIAIGSNAIGHSQSVTIGANATTTPSFDASNYGGGSVAVGYGAQAISDARLGRSQSAAFGYGARANVDGGLSLGTAAITTAVDGVAIGNASVASTAAGVIGYDPRTGLPAAITSPTWVATMGAVSVGGAGNTRQITNVAAGTEDTDAVNVAQLQAAQTHYYSVNDNGVPGANYNNDGATGVSALAAGVGARAEGQADTAMGFDSQASGSNSIAIGTSARALQSHATAMGYSAEASGQSAVAIGFVAQAAGAGNIAIGHGAATTGANVTAMGTFASATRDNAIALGTGASATYENALAMGTNARAVNADDIAIGRDALASGGDSLAIGGQATGLASTAIDGVAEGDSSTALGGRAVGAASLSIHDGLALGQNSNAIGTEVVARGNRSTVLGWVSEANGDQSLAIGAEAIADGVSSMAIGTGARANGENSISIGTGNVVNGDRSGAIGDPSIIDASDSYSVGNNNTLGAAANNSFVLGNNVTIDVDNATALGNGTGVTQAGGVALGSGSLASTAAGAVGYDPRTGVPSTDTSATWVSTQAAVSVGSAGNTRQITNVAAGTEETDAVNVAQLQAAQAAATTHYYSVNDNGVIGGNYDNDGALGTNSLAAGVDTFAFGEGSTAVGSQNFAIRQYSTAVGHDNLALAVSSTAVGDSNQVWSDQSGAFGFNNRVGEIQPPPQPTPSRYSNSYAVGSGNVIEANNTFVLGNNANLNVDNATALGHATSVTQAGGVALGSGSIASTAAGVAGYDPRTGLPSTDISATWVSTLAAVSVGSAGNTRQITHVAAGTEDTDAVNVAQLQAAQDAATTHYYSVNDNGTPTGNYNNDGATGLNALAAGVNATAVGADAVSIGSGAQASRIGSVAIGSLARSQGTDAISLGRNALAGQVSNGAGSIAIGADSQAIRARSVAIGNSAVVNATVASGVALGAATNVAADFGVALGFGSVANRAAGSTGYSPAGATATDIATIQATNSTNLGAVSVGTGAAGGNRQIINVAAGTQASDAVNVAQLQAVATTANAGWNATDAAGNTANIGPNGTVTFESGNTNIAVSQTGVDDDGVVDITLSNNLDLTAAGSVTTGDTLMNNAGVAVGTNVALGSGGLTVIGGTTTTVVNGDGLTSGSVALSGVSNDITGLSNTTLTDPTFATAGRAATEEQLQLVEQSANAGWNATDANGNAANIGPGGTVTFESGNTNIAVSQTGADDDGVVDITLSNNLDLTAAGSVTTGDTLMNNAGVAVGTNVALGSGGLTVIGGTTTTIVSGTGVSSGNVVLSGVSNDITGLSNRTLIDPTFATAGRAATEEQLRLVRNEITSGFTPPTRYYGVNSLGGGNQLGEGATGEDAMALGKDAESEGQDAVAMGRGARATEDDSMALGAGSQALSLNALAIGAGAVASHENSIALGAGSATTVGARAGYQGAYVGSSSSTGEMNIGGRQLTGVAAGSAATDAVNVSQLQGGVTQAITEANNYTDARIATIEGDLVDIRGDITDIQGDIVRIEGDITNLDTRVGDVEGDVASLTTTVNQFDNRVTNLERGGSGPFQVTQGETYVAPAPTGANASAGGNGAVASGDNSTAVGNQSVASGDNSTAIGQGAVASHDNSVALGRGSATTVGAQRDYNAAYVGTSTSTGEVNIGGRTISGVAPGIAGTDAVNVNQLDAGVDYAINQANAYTDTRFNQFEGDMWNLERGYRGGTASAMAMAGLPQAYLPGKSMLSFAFGGYQGEYGMAFGLSTISDNGRWVYKAQATGNTTRDWGFSVGAGLQW